MDNPPSPTQLSFPLKLLVVGVLYFSEGVPYGFVVTTLSFYLRGQGVPLEQIGILSLLGLAWSFKILWSPWPTVSAPGPPGLSLPR